jgi:hypothetical protein
VSADRIVDLVGHILQAAFDARSYVDGLNKDDFLSDSARSRRSS